MNLDFEGGEDVLDVAGAEEDATVLEAFAGDY